MFQKIDALIALQAFYAPEILLALRCYADFEGFTGIQREQAKDAKKV